MDHGDRAESGVLRLAGWVGVEFAAMYGEQGDQRDDRPASPLGVRIVVIILLLSGLALAALPLTVLLTGASDAGRIALHNASGESLHSVRIVRTVGRQVRLVGSAHEIADGAGTAITFEPDGSLRLRIDFDTASGHHSVPLVLQEPVVGDFETLVEVGPQFEVQVTRSARTTADESSAVPAPRPAAPPAPPAPPAATTLVATTPGPFDIPDGWSEKWAPWFAHIDWVIGPEAGMAEARASGRPMMMFYTATW